MPSVNEEDVVLAFRQAVEQEMRKMQRGDAQQREDLFAEGIPLEETVRRLAQRHNELEHEVALLRTILLRLVSDPVDNNIEHTIP
ncbi:MAG: hypothetical protein JO316_11170 [Abitibacteriaceae bacterium]|nr:hypothetical protein [Abditibacteriaceae bacterium]